MSETAEARPAGGMQRIPFPTESYEHPSLPLSAKRLLNVYPEAAPQDARNRVALRTGPGVVYSHTIGAGPLLALNTDMVSSYYCVSGTQAFRQIVGLSTLIGDVGVASDPDLRHQHVMVTIAVSPYHVVICVPPRLYYATHDGLLTEIDTTGFPGGGCNSVTYIDGYFVGTQHRVGNIFFVSRLQDPSVWDGLDYQSADSLPTMILRAITHRGELWLLGYHGAEVWYTSGDQDFPFRRQSGGVIPYGFEPQSVAIIDNSVWWVSPDGCIYRNEGYKPLRVSTHAVEAVVDVSNPDNALAVAYMQEGHSLYAVTFTDLQRTLVYDVATQRWHDRTSSASLTGPWRPLVAGRVGELVYVGDAAGRFYSLDPNAGTDDGVPIVSQVTFPPLYATTRRAFCSRFELEAECPPGADVLLSWSDDGGKTYTMPRVMRGADALANRKRLVATRLGSFRQRVFRVQTAGRATFYAADADIVSGQT